jgi:hypothetical protein
MRAAIWKSAPEAYGEKALYRELQFLGRCECNLFARFDLNYFAGSRIAAHACSAFSDLQDAKACNADALTLFGMLGDKADEIAEKASPARFKQRVARMPRGPKGEKRPTDVIGNCRSCNAGCDREIEDTLGKTPKRAKGGKPRAKELTPAQRAEIAKATGSARWKKAALRKFFIIVFRRVHPLLDRPQIGPSADRWAFHEDGT